MQSPPQIRIYLFTHRNWRIVRNDPTSPVHRYWAIRPRTVHPSGGEALPSKQFGPFPLWSVARDFIDQWAIDQIKAMAYLVEHNK